MKKFMKEAIGAVMARQNIVAAFLFAMVFSAQAQITNLTSLESTASSLGATVVTFFGYVIAATLGVAGVALALKGVYKLVRVIGRALGL